MSRIQVLTACGAALLLFTPAPAAHAAAPAPSRLLDDFEDGDLLADRGLGWIVLTDELFGGASRATIEVVHPGASNSRGALRLAGRAARGDLKLVLAGTWVSLGENGAPCDLSPFESIRFRVRGNGIGMEVGVRCGNASGNLYNAMAGFTAGDEWSLVEIPIRQLRAGAPSAPEASRDPTSAWYLGFTTPVGAEGEFSIDIDDVELVVARDSAPAAAPPSPSANEPVFACLVDLVPPSRVSSFPWISLAQESAGDAIRPSLPDARSLWYHFDAGEDRLWFRVLLESAPPADWFGINVAIDADRDQANGTAWWGTNGEFHWDRLVTAYLFRVGSHWQGSIGVADSAGVARGEMGSLAQTEVIVGADPAGRALFVGIPRASVDDDLEMDLIATVGSAMAANDDVPNVGFAALRHSGDSTK